MKLRLVRTRFKLLFFETCLVKHLTSCLIELIYSDVHITRIKINILLYTVTFRKRITYCRRLKAHIIINKCWFLDLKIVFAIKYILKSMTILNDFKSHTGLGFFFWGGGCFCGENRGSWLLFLWCYSCNIVWFSLPIIWSAWQDIQNSAT